MKSFCCGDHAESYTAWKVMGELQGVMGEIQLFAS